MAESGSRSGDSGATAPRRRRAYVQPTLETVEVLAEEALLAVCAFDATTSGQVFQGAPCSACFTTS